MPVPKFLQTYLASYDLDKLDCNDPNVSNEIISRVLNLGDEKAVAWIFENYTLDRIREVVKKPKRGVWNEESLNYWKYILKIDDIAGYERAIMNIYPV